VGSSNQVLNNVNQQVARQHFAHPTLVSPLVVSCKELTIAILLVRLISDRAMVVDVVRANRLTLKLLVVLHQERMVVAILVKFSWQVVQAARPA
jgi:hypothetical protein